ncbi:MULTISPECIES: heat-inducible transcriptional repressor HrcA [Clostridium]|uniref:Heat-inducible transcription repressor HrcA n=4 Tax=Clostridium TaxID=1485 RepID=D8GP18_CLOLD|nr:MULTISPECIES: heat-inducible transcriptional repressor HrcA [Clostridium]ADK13864.1 predicted heat-inducible transcription repressor [Clostridium ljungdahlii DSM 13528]AGY77094.1 heat-inducible transcriptional repressor HrcA [Clostridium autoethanogenum DSM 10061]ALU37237.1 Heat-inducible transcription repressor HrcA [Clostridium autoethanogenum DSM 10061]OAA87353.1 Heat-inducible transcription repressor HrcA [Clostridium ljungdahlii DSM 13528]OAA92498.1 Heat-inducible transcription repress
MEMDERKIKILQAIVNDYINTAEPVGSRTIAKKYNLGVSSATIRNEMADLEEMGYLEQLHSSSGRIPSNNGYRLYVDKLMHIPNLSQEEMYIIKSQIIDAALFEVDKILKQAVCLLSELTKLTSIVRAPSVKRGYIKHIQLINIESSTNILLVLIIDSGIIKNNLIKVGKTISDDILVKLSNMLNVRLKNLSAEQINLEVINNLKNDFQGYEDIFNNIISALYDSLNSVDNSNIYTQGATNIFNYPEYKDIEKAREFLSMMDNKDKVSSLLNSNSNISVKIGKENYTEGAEDCSVVSAVYSLNERPIGEIGVIGPTRIPYSKVISILANVVKEMNYILSNAYSDEK